jgi:hypothetical protein
MYNQGRDARTKEHFGKPVRNATNWQTFLCLIVPEYDKIVQPLFCAEEGGNGLLANLDRHVLGRVLFANINVLARWIAKSSADHQFPNKVILSLRLCLFFGGDDG